MEVDLNKLIQMVTAQVISELQTRGIKISHNPSLPGIQQFLRTKSERIDMGKYRSPVLTENHIRRLHELTGEVTVPMRTVITPKARELAKEKQICITFETN